MALAASDLPDEVETLKALLVAARAKTRAPEAKAERADQARRLAEWTATWQGAGCVVVAGDFNAYPGEPALEVMKSRFASAHETANGREPEKTWPTPVNTYDPSPPGCLDYIFVAGAQVLSASLAMRKSQARVTSRPPPRQAP